MNHSKMIIQYSKSSELIHLRQAESLCDSPTLTLNTENTAQSQD